MPGVSQERQMRDIMQTCRSGRDGVARSVLRRFFARGVKASMRGVIRGCGASVTAQRTPGGHGRGPVPHYVGGESAVGRAAPVRVAYRWCDSLRPPGPRGGARNGGRRTPWRGLRARAGSSSNLGHVKAIVPWSPDKGRCRIGISAHISPCVSPPPGRAQSLRQEQRMRGMAQPESAKPQLGESGRQHDGSRR